MTFVQKIAILDFVAAGGLVFHKHILFKRTYIAHFVKHLFVFQSSSQTLVSKLHNAGVCVVPVI